MHMQKKPSKKEQSAAFFLGVKKKSCLIRILPQDNLGDNLDSLPMLSRHVDTVLQLFF